MTVTQYSLAQYSTTVQLFIPSQIAINQECSAALSHDSLHGNIRVILVIVES